MFRVIFHPSSGAHNTLSTVSGINPLNTELNPICHLLALLGAHHILHVSRVRINETCTATWRPATFTTGSSTGLINARYCRYSVMGAWWWVKYHPKHVEQLKDLNKLYFVASCWIIIVILYDPRFNEHKKTHFYSCAIQQWQLQNRFINCKVAHVLNSTPCPEGAWGNKGTAPAWSCTCRSEQCLVSQSSPLNARDMPSLCFGCTSELRWPGNCVTNRRQHVGRKTITVPVANRTGSLTNTDPSTPGPTLDAPPY